jgi:hypothetical protein
MATMSVLSKCQIIDCVDAEKTADLASNDCCPIQMCNTCQCCFCYFVCPIDHKKIEIRVFESISKSAAVEDQYLLSDFTSDLWQPPRA